MRRHAVRRAVLGALVLALMALVPALTGGQPAARAAGTPATSAYWLVASDGGIFAFGGAGFYGSTGGIRLNAPIVGMAGTGDTHGYWLDAADGGIFAFGDAGFYGSMGGRPLNRPVVGMAATHDGGGYWLVASDGGIFAFGDAGFYGSTGAIHLNRPITGMAANPNGQGYWFVAADGGVFAFGDAGFYGSLGGVPQSRPVVAMTADSTGGGYWFTNSNGAVSNFGDAVYWGSAPTVLAQPVVGMVQATGNGQLGQLVDPPYPSGATGYDVSNYQCGGLPPPPHAIGIVEVEGASFGGVNPCLGAEAAWAGAGLNLYVYLTFGQSGSSSDARCNSGALPYSGSAAACNYGFETTVDAFQKAANAGVQTEVGWWLDVEDGSLGGHQGASAAMVQGAIDGLRSVGINEVGIYASPANWGSLVGNYQPDVPYWAADWGPAPQTTCAAVHSWYGDLPSGPVQIVQYQSNTFDDDYAC